MRGPIRGCSENANILELPRILAVEIFWEESLSTGEGRPIAVYPDHVAEIRAGNIENTLEVHLVGLHDALARMFKRPDPKVPDEALDPHAIGSDKKTYDEAAHELTRRFVANYAEFKPFVVRRSRKSAIPIAASSSANREIRGRQRKIAPSIDGII